MWQGMHGGADLLVQTRGSLTVESSIENAQGWQGLDEEGAKRGRLVI